jgi:hypothetical protein
MNDWFLCRNEDQIQCSQWQSECQFECHNLRIRGSVNPQFSPTSGDVLLRLSNLVIVIISFSTAAYPKRWKAS